MISLLVFIGTLCDRMIQKRNVRVSLNYKLSFLQHYNGTNQTKEILFIWKFCHSVAPPLMQFALLHLAQWGKSGKKVKFEKYDWVVVVEDYIPSEIWFHEIFFCTFLLIFLHYVPRSFFVLVRKNGMFTLLVNMQRATSSFMKCWKRKEI